MPLVDHSKLHQQDEGRHHVVEVVLAVVEICEGGAFEQRVPAVLLIGVAGVVEKLHFVLENLHPQHSKDVVHHLKRRRISVQTATTLKHSINTKL